LRDKGSPLSLARGTWIAVIAVMAMVSLPLAAPPSTAATTGHSPTAMLVFLRPGGAPTSLAARVSERDAQASVASLARSVGATVLASQSVPDTITVLVTSAQAAALSRNPLVSSVLPNATIPGPADP